jgi:sugar-specific transcriptional regulator TrmB
METEAYRILAKYFTLQSHLNPLEFEHTSRTIFKGNPEIDTFLQQNFRNFEREYSVVGPSQEVCSSELRSMVMRIIGRSVDVSLRLFIAIPRKLLNTTTARRVKIAIRFHGGGGVRNYATLNTVPC